MTGITSQKYLYSNIPCYKKKEIVLHKIAGEEALGLCYIRRNDTILPLIVNFPFFLLLRQEKIQSLQFFFF